MKRILGWAVLTALVVNSFNDPGAHADVIARWDFNDQDLIVDEGMGTLTTNFPAADVGFFFGTTKNGPVGIPAGQALGLKNRTNNGTGRLDFHLDTTGRGSLLLSLAAQKTATGFVNDQLAYSADGGSSFSDFGGAFNPPLSFDVLTFDLSTISSLNNNPDAVIRITLDGATTAAGNNRFDNIQFDTLSAFSITPSPEPPGWALGSLAFCLFFSRKLVAALNRRLDNWVTWLKPKTGTDCEVR